MEEMNGWMLILAILIPVLGLVGIVYVILTQYFDNQRQQQLDEWRAKKTKEYIPLQVQAYERFILYLERISPERLVFRVNKPGMSARQLQTDMLAIIRDEFDHNLAQQLYVSPQAWDGINAAREETVKLLNVAAERVDKNADSFTFATAILEVVGQLKKLPTEVAVGLLKAEFRKKMNE